MWQQIFQWKDIEEYSFKKLHSQAYIWNSSVPYSTILFNKWGAYYAYPYTLLLINDSYKNLQKKSIYICAMLLWLPRCEDMLPRLVYLTQMLKSLKSVLIVSLEPGSSVLSKWGRRLTHRWHVLLILNHWKSPPCTYI